MRVLAGGEGKAMFGSVVLDVAIGLCLLFLFVSLVCSAIREVIEAVLNTRASDLERGIREMLDDPDGQGAVRALYSHPMVFALFDGSYAPERLQPHRSLLTGTRSLRMPIRQRGNLPAYIPAGNFARAFLDLVVRGPIGGAGPATGEAVTVRALSARAQAMPDSRTRRALLSALDGAEDDLGRVRWAIERWFDSCMERVSGWYKRRTQVILFGIGLLAAGVMNVDAFSVGKALFEDKALRDGAVAQAASLLPPGTGGLSQQAREGFTALRDELAQIRFPCGWGNPPPQRLRHPGAGGKPGPLAPGAVLQMLIGWTVTAFAVTLGAPFWFDLLNRFTVARSTIKPGSAIRH